jgi:hypothetical protein
MKMRLVSIAWTALVASGALMVGSATPALAQYEVGAGLNVATPLSDADDALKTGWGFDGWLGYGLDLPFLHITPDLRFTYSSLPGDAAGADTIGIWRGVVGGKVAIGEIFRVYGTAHFGYGNAESEGASTYDLGGGLEFTALPLINIGAGVSYNSLNTDVAIQWLNVGAWASLHF